MYLSVNKAVIHLFEKTLCLSAKLAPSRHTYPQNYPLVSPEYNAVFSNQTVFSSNQALFCLSITLKSTPM